ncbi:MAG: TonB-dependent receptor plug domain-containing protein, partial [Candidatus Poribacteria bacterium]
SVNDRRLLSLTYQGKNISPLLSQVKAQVAFHDREGERKKRVTSSFSDVGTLQTEVQATSLLGDIQRFTYGVHFHHDASEGWQEREKERSESPHATWDNIGVFVQDEISLLGRLMLAPALRWDAYALDREKDPANPKDIGVQQNNTSLTGSLGAVFSVNDYLNLTGSIGRGFRAPNNSEYESTPSEFTFGVMAPTPTALDPEYSTNFETGIRVKHRRFQATLSGYYMIISNLLSSERGTYQGKDWYDWDDDGIRDPDEDIFIKTNGEGEVVIYGVEIGTQAPINDAWSVSGNFSFIDGEDRSGDEEAPLGRAFPTYGSLKLRWREPDTGRYWAEFSTRLVAEFDSSRIPESRLMRDPAYKVNPQDRKSPLLGGDGSVPGYTIFNLRGGVEVTEWASLTFGVENLTDRNYRNKDSRIDAPGLNFVFALTLKP